jgi:HK97 family phage prohead protease
MEETQMAKAAQDKKTEILKEIRVAELRAVTDPGSDKMIIEGYAVVFETPATHYGFTEIIDRNAFVGADMKDVPLRYNHNDTWLIIARTRNNSLQLIVDDKGLFIRAELIDTQTNRDIYKSIQAGLIDKMSFAFTTAKDEWNYDTNTRRVLQIDKLFDVSVVDTAFYDTTSIYARALDELESGKEALESEKTRQLEVEKLKIEIKSK